MKTISGAASGHARGLRRSPVQVKWAGVALAILSSALPCHANSIGLVITWNATGGLQIVGTTGIVSQTSPLSTTVSSNGNNGGATASSTSTLIDILTPGASYTAASGTVYGSEIDAPEPATWMLALIALALIVPAVRWRASAASGRARLRERTGWRGATVTIRGMGVALAFVLSALPCHADNFGLVNTWNVYAVQIPGSTGYVSQTTPLSTTVSTSDSNCGATSNATQTDTAFYGSLSASASGSASNSLSCGLFAGAGTERGDYYDGDPVAQYYDQLHITSSTLANGTPVTMMFTEDFLGSASFVDPDGGGDANITDNLQVSDGGGPVSINLFLTNGGETEIVTSYVGDYLSIEGQLFAFGGAWANYNGAPLITSTFQYSGQSSTLIDILTPGASYTAASGTVYGSDLSAPEPGTWMLALIALAAIVPAAYRRIRGTSIRLATAT